MKLPDRGLINTWIGMSNSEMALPINSRVGVRPPTDKSVHYSMRSAPPSWAAFALSKLLAHISTIIQL